MRSAVLKNRLLQLTEREFDEARYGGGSMVAVALRVPGLLELVSERPAVLKLTDPSVVSNDAPLTAEKRQVASPFRWKDVRLRPDLWHAVVASRSGTTYVWDVLTEQAREQTLLDGQSQFVLPSIGPEELAKLRAQFSAERVQDPQMKDRIAGWLDDFATPIPKRIRREWAEYLKSVAVTRVQEWFQMRGIQPPADLLQFASTADLPATSDVVRTRTLKSSLLRAIQMMTEEELRQVLVPASVLMRYEQER